MSSASLFARRGRAAPAGLEGFAGLVTASSIALVWWIGGIRGASHPAPAACPQGDRVSSAQISEAAGRVRAAAETASYTAMGGSPYVAAKVGLARGSPEYALAQSSARELEVAQQALARLCAQARAAR